jgi:DMSO/TMAO reductase YedYZ molybdopterin-dependent catalytic subunit
MRQNAGTEENIQIKGAVGNSATFTCSQLQSLPHVTITVTLSSSSHPEDNGVFNYTGVALNTLLEEAQVSTNVTSVYVHAVDGYGTTIPIQDAEKSNTILAYEKDGASLTPLSSGGEGPFRLVIGDDAYAQRWTRGVSVIEVR